MKILNPMHDDSPDFGYWRLFETLKIRDILALMQNIDPRSPTGTTDRSGNALDLNDEQHILISAVKAGSLIAAPPAPSAVNGDTEVTLTSLVQWLQKNRWSDLATHLSATDANALSRDMTPTQRRALLDIRSKRGCARLILENWETIVKLYGPEPDGRQVLRAIRPAGTIDGKMPALKTVQNSLLNLRKEKLIP